MGKQYTAKQFIDAIPGTGGIITAIAKRVGCEWHTCKRYIEAMPTLAQAYQDECERILDLAETQLIKSIQDGDMQAVKYMLSTKGKVRGYTERHEVTGADNGPLVVKWLDDDDSEDTVPAARGAEGISR